MIFQYPILRIVGCKGDIAEKLGKAILDFQYPILRIVGCKPAVRMRSSRRPRLSVSYPADRWLQGGDLAHALDALGLSFSILSCGSLVASTFPGRGLR